LIEISRRMRILRYLPQTKKLLSLPVHPLTFLGLLSVLVEAFQAVSQYKGSDGIRVARKASKA
jgi:hypothetical protein